jgi:ubiquinone/menaquinone biosynthesis C-methylase UbiE
MNQAIKKIIWDNQINIRPFVGKYLANKNILDAGCGNGINAYFFKKRYSANVTLLDNEDIRSNEVLFFPFVKASLEKIPFSDNDFDVAFLQYVIHHISPEISIVDALKELIRVSKILIIIEEITTEKTDLEKAIKFDAKMNKIIHPNVEMPIYCYYSDEQLKQYFNELGLEIIEEKVINEGSKDAGDLQSKIYVLSS